MRPDMNGAFDEFDNMVEALEEQEDMVECKECFDLFPKTDCFKQTQGYICPTCNHMLISEPELDSRMITTDLFSHEFPDVQDYDPNTTRDYEQEPTVSDALQDLIEDEYEAINGYEVADETVQHSSISEDEKDEILDTLEHIKEEEEEHIDELKELTGEEIDKEDSDDDDDEEDSDPEGEESEKLHEAVEAQTWVGYTLAGGEFVGACKAFSEEEAYEILEREYVQTWVPMGYEPDELVVELATDEDLDETDYLTETLFEKSVLTEGALINHKLDKLFKNGYAIYCYAPQTAANKELPSEHKKVVAKYKDAFKAAQVVSRRNPDLIVYLFPVEIDVSGMSPAVQKLLNVKKGYCTQIVSFAKGTVKTDSTDKLLKEFKTLSKEDKKLAKLLGNTTDSEEEDIRTEVEAEAEAETMTETEEETETETETETTTDSSSKVEEPAASTDSESEGSTSSAGESGESEETVSEPTSTKSDLWRRDKHREILKALQAAGLDTSKLTVNKGGKKRPSKELRVLRKTLFGENFSEDPKDDVECTWCHDTFDRSECRYEVDLEWLCSRCEAAIKSRGETLTFKENNYWDFLDEDLKDTDAALSELKDTQAALKSTASSLSNMTSAMKEGILNLSPADFAECVDSSRVELWGLEESEDGVAHAVLIKSYDEVSSEDVQSCHDEMLDLDGMFTFSFTASGKPSLFGWNAEQLRELNQAGFKGISFDNPAYEEAVSLAWRIK